MAPPATILWDLDTCFLEDDIADVVRAVRQLAFTFRAGPIPKINAYTSSNDLTHFTNEIQELKISGVNVIDANFIQGEEKTLQLIITDMFLEVIDSHTKPPTLIVISDNTSLTYQVSLLKNRCRLAHLVSSDTLREVVQKVQGQPQTINWGQSQSAQTSPTIPVYAGAESGERSPPSSSSGTSFGYPTLTPTVLSPDNSWTPIADPASGTLPAVRPTYQTDVNPRFAALVAVLEQARDEGRTTVIKALLGNMLGAHSRNVYADAGVKNFKKYIEEADKAGIITLGGGGTDAWVALKTLTDEPQIGSGMVTRD